MSALRSVRGTHDIVGETALRHRRVVETGRAVAARYGYAEIAVPVFEFTEVFARTLGETSDIVTKEMYSFEDHGGERITLRPEFTAGVARALISGGLGQGLPLRLFTSGPVFRYERPQKGRLRQFHQIDVEVLGAPEPEADIEVIAVGRRILEALELGSKVTLELNTLGDPESRRTYRERLVDYLSAFREQLSDDSRLRLGRNPLRILDSKDSGDRAILTNAPVLTESLNDASRAFFDKVRAGLDALAIDYEINPRLVRGLDYYTHTVFEWVTDDIGAQSTICAGGRYDGLVERLGGRPTPGAGFALGLERVMLLQEAVTGAEESAAAADVYICVMAEQFQGWALELAGKLRESLPAFRIRTHAGGGKLKNQMKRADQSGARFAIVIGEDEVREHRPALKYLREDRPQESLDVAALIERLRDSDHGAARHG